MKKLLIFSLLMSIIYSGCDSVTEDNELAFDELSLSCGVNNPVTDLDWLSKIIDELESNKSGYRAVKLAQYDKGNFIIVEAIWEGRKGTIYDCNGTNVTGKGNLTYDQFIERAKIIKVLYSKG